MQKFLFIFKVILTVTLFTCFTGDGETKGDNALALKILTRADQIRGPQKPFMIKNLAIQYKKNKEVQRARLDLYVKGNSSDKDEYRSLARFLFPEYNKGRMMLYKSDGVWIFVPGTKRVIRLSSRQRLIGEASNGDILSINFQKDYTPVLEGKEVIDGKKCYRLYLTAKSSSSPYSSLRYWVTVKENRPVKCIYYALSGRELKISYFKKYRKILGALRPSKIEIYDAVKRDYKTVIYYLQLKYKNLPEKYFQKDYMSYIRW